MAQKKTEIPADAICVDCHRPNSDHDAIVDGVSRFRFGRTGCDHFRQARDNFVSVMDSCRTILNYDPYRPVMDEENN